MLLAVRVTGKRFALDDDFRLWDVHEVHHLSGIIAMTYRETCIAAAFLCISMAAAASALAEPLRAAVDQEVSAQFAATTATFGKPDGVRAAARAIVYDVDEAASVIRTYDPADRPSREDAGGFVIDATPVATPEPGPLLVLLAGLLGVAWVRLRRR